MSETTNKISLLSVEVPDSVDNAAKNLTDLPTKNAGQTLADCWYLIFGGISHMAEKRKIKYALDLETFKISLEEKIAKIPTENLIEARTQIVMPALENSKYCVEEPILRDMFVNLISSSIDNRKSNLVHPAFGDFLKTMSPLDARNLLLLKEKMHLPICHLKMLKSPDSGYTYLNRNIFIINADNIDIEKTAQSISSLTRLGLIESPYGVLINEASAYFAYDEFLRITKLRLPGFNLEIEKRIIQLTPLGESFLQICSP